MEKEKIGVIGPLGGHNAIFAAAFDPRRSSSPVAGGSVDYYNAGERNTNIMAVV